jgi:NADPH:quinone reductase-like Zn-dependent oxidoreductase
MRAYELHDNEGRMFPTLNHMRPVSEPGHGEVLICVHAVSLNHRDLLVADGIYGTGTKPGVIPLSGGR